MEHIIIGTAGHIDHGKTTLIRRLTSRDTDTTKEERQRGISIDLGFTYFDLPDGIRAGIIDVPGHEKFLPNMLAGVCGMDMVLLVIALDEGVKPQTLEHMEILSQLNVEQGIVVLNKLDCVEAEWADLMEEEVKERLSGTPFSSWRRIRVSAVRGDGIETLKREIADQAGRKKKNYQVSRPFRMPVDRVLSIEGRGTVLTGTVLEGVIHSGDEIEIYPEKRHVRIRSIQIHGETAACVEAGQRAALLVSGVKRGDVFRGNIAAAPETLKPAERLDVKLTLSRNTDRKIKNRTRVHLHTGSGQMLCRIVLLDCEELERGRSCYAQLVLEERTAVKKGDRFIVRFYSPVETIGGGIVLDECAKKHKRMDESVLQRLKQMEENKTEQVLYDLICSVKKGIPSQEKLEAEYGGDAQEFADLLDLLRKDNTETIVIKEKKREFFVWKKNLENHTRQIAERFEEERKIHPYRKWIPQNILKQGRFREWDKEEFSVLINYMVQNKQLCQKKSFYFCPEVPVVKDRRFERVEDFLLRRLEQARFQFVDFRELCPSGIPEDMYRDILEVLTEEEKLVQISEEFYTTAELEREAVELVKHYFQENEVLTYTTLRDLLETTRRSVRPLVAYLDGQKITRPCGKETERRKGGTGRGNPEDIIEF